MKLILSRTGFGPSWRFGANGPLLPAEFGLQMIGGRRGERVADLTDTEWRRLELWFCLQALATSTDPGSSSECQPATGKRPPPTRATRQRC
jgi:hypothetical protein